MFKRRSSWDRALKDFREQLSGIYGGDYEGKEPDWDSMFQRMAVPIMRSAAIRIGIQPAELAKKVKVRAVNAQDVNGVTRFYEGGKSIEVEINKGLMIYCYKITKLLVSRIVIGGDSGRVIRDTKHSWESSLDYARDLMASFWAGTLINSSTVLKADTLSDEQLFLTSYLLNAVESFALAHEFGHIVIHSTSARVNGVSRSEFVLASLKIAPERRLHRWAEEISADHMGLEFVLAGNEDVPHRIVSYSGAMLLLGSVKMLEDYHAKYFSDRLPDSHPPADVRLGFLDAVTADNPPEAFSMGNSFREVMDRMAKAA